MRHEKEIIDPKTGELKEVNFNFIQFYEDNIDLFSKITMENSKALSVFWWILKRMDTNNALVVSQQALAEALNVSRQTIYSAVLYLKKEKVLAVLKSGSTNIYAINSEIAWKSNAPNKKFAHFTAKVYLTSEEQDIEYQTQLFGHAVKKQNKQPKRIKKSPKEAIKDFEHELA